MRFQASTDSIHVLQRGFSDEESGLLNFYVSIQRSDDVILVNDRAIGLNDNAAFDVSLTHGDVFVVTVRAQNLVNLSTSVLSTRVAVDTTPPVIFSVSERLDASVPSVVENGDLISVGVSSLTLSVDFATYDLESSAIVATACLGTLPGGCDTVPPVDALIAPSGSGSVSFNVEGLGNGVTYYSTVVVGNGAGLSSVFSSNGFKADILAPECGTVVDGQYFQRRLIGPSLVQDLIWVMVSQVTIGY